MSYRDMALVNMAATYPMKNDTKIYCEANKRLRSEYPDNQKAKRALEFLDALKDEVLQRVQVVRSRSLGRYPLWLAPLNSTLNAKVLNVATSSCIRVCGLLPLHYALLSKGFYEIIPPSYFAGLFHDNYRHSFLIFSD
jgi:hypothetical protein